MIHTSNFLKSIPQWQLIIRGKDILVNVNLSCNVTESSTCKNNNEATTGNIIWVKMFCLLCSRSTFDYNFLGERDTKLHHMAKGDVTV